MMVSANATTINMTRVSHQAIEEGSVAEYVCKTGCAYPGPVVLWYMDDKPVDIHDGFDIKNIITCEDYNGQKTKSVLQLTTKREMNNKKVKCALENDDSKFSEHNLNITCKYLLVHENQVKSQKLLILQ